MAGNGLWRGWLRDTTLAVPDPDAALGYWAELFGGRREGDAVVLGSDTRLLAVEGAPGYARATLELAGDDAAADELIDPDGRPYTVVGVDSVEEALDATIPRLGHLTFESPDPLGAQAFYERLGFRLSEGLGPVFRWLRCNPIHHTVAVARADAPRLHHVGIELADRAALIAACDRLAELEHRVQYGPGRHMVGGNVFLYFLDRHGIRFEYFCELERILDPERTPLIHEGVPRERSINLWGPQPPEEYFRGV